MDAIIRYLGFQNFFLSQNSSRIGSKKKGKIEEYKNLK